MLKIEGLTDVGKVRKINEDNFKIFHSEEYSYAMVADGMGGHLAGETASKMAVESVSEYISTHMQPELDRFQVKELLNRAFIYANNKIYEYSCENERVMGMGTTATLCMVRDGYLIYAHVGDSRAYLISEKSIVQLTRDHSYVQELVKLGQITPEEAKHHPRRNFITRAMGVEPEVKADTGVKEYNNEKLLLCSDGLFGEIEDKEIGKLVEKNTAKQAVKKLIELANKRGGGDNITAVLMEGEREDV